MSGIEWGINFVQTCVMYFMKSFFGGVICFGSLLIILFTIIKIFESIKK